MMCDDMADAFVEGCTGQTRARAPAVETGSPGGAVRAARGNEQLQSWMLGELLAGGSIVRRAQ